MEPANRIQAGRGTKFPFCQIGMLMCLTGLCFLSFPVLAEVGTEQNLRDTVLEHRELVQEHLSEMDMNQDEITDVSDIVSLLKTIPETLLPAASFEQFSSEIREGEDTAIVKVNFSTSFSGMLRYSISGTAAQGADYGTLHDSVLVNGAYADIPIIINDDDELEDKAETIVLTLYYKDGEDLGYVPGASTLHTLYIYDNDALWNGTFENNGMALHFQMKIVQTPLETTGGLVTDGYGIIPLNNGENEWPASSVGLSTDIFNATVEGIVIPKEKTLANTDLERKFVFLANSQNDGHLVDPDARISGTLKEFISCPSQAQLEREIHGTFTLVRQIPVIEAEQKFE